MSTDIATLTRRVEEILDSLRIAAATPTDAQIERLRLIKNDIRHLEIACWELIEEKKEARREGARS